MKKLAKILSVILAMVMLCSIMPCASFAAEAASGTCGNNLTWTLDSDGTLTISGTGNMYNWSSSSSVPWSNIRSSVKSVVIESGMTSIGKYAFYYCKSLVNIEIPGSVTSIGGSAFNGCTSLTSITIPEGVTNIGAYAFYCCTSLASVTIPGSVTSIGNHAFRGCESLASVTIGNGVKSIEEWAFYGCTSLVSVTIPGSVTSIGEYAFCNCYSLTSITIPDGVTSIGDSVFSGCESLTSITIPEGVTSIGDYAFSGCTSLTSVTIPGSVTSIGNWAFSYCTSLASITIPEGVTTIGGGAFDDCTNLVSITIPDSVTTIGASAFSRTAYYNDESNWENGVLYIGNYLIRANEDISGKYDIKDGTLCIACNAFDDCTSLTSITIPGSVTSIGYYAFFWCESLADVYYGGRETDWNKISIGSDNECLTNATIHYSAIPEAEIVKSGELDAGIKWTLDKNGVFTVTAEETLSEYSPVSVGYNEDGEMKQSASVSGTGAKMDTEGVKFIKIFIWESMESMKPVCEAYRIEIEK